MLLKMLTAGSSNRYTCLLTASQRNSSDTGISDQLAGFCSWNEHRAKRTLWKTTLAKDTFNLQGTARDVGSMFEYCRIAGHECGGGKAEHLPVGKVPGHQGQNNTKRLK